MTFNTGNNVPSTDPRDLYDNAENLDKLVNGTDPFYADRLGKLRESWAGMENSFNNAQEGRETAFTLSQADKESRFQAFLLSSGYVSKGDYAANVVLEERNEYVAVDAATTGTTAGLYRPGPGATLPLTLTGTWATDSGNLVLLGDDVLRQELSEDDGAEIVGFKRTGIATAVARNVQQKIADVWHVKDFGAVGDGVTNDTTAIQSAIEAAAASAHKPALTGIGGTYLVRELKPASGVNMIDFDFLQVAEDFPATSQWTILKAVLKFDQVTGVYCHNISVNGQRGEQDMTMAGTDNGGCHAFQIRASHNITLEDCSATMMATDALAMDGYTAGGLVPPTGIKVIRPHFTYSRRNNISVVSVDGLQIEGGYLGQSGVEVSGSQSGAGLLMLSDGVTPWSSPAIDFEPESNYLIDNVEVRNVVIDGCRSGPMIYEGSSITGSVVRNILFDNLTIKNLISTKAFEIFGTRNDIYNIQLRNIKGYGNYAVNLWSGNGVLVDKWESYAADGTRRARAFAQVGDQINTLSVRSSVKNARIERVNIANYGLVTGEFGSIAAALENVVFGESCVVSPTQSNVSDMTVKNTWLPTPSVRTSRTRVIPLFDSAGGVLREPVFLTTQARGLGSIAADSYKAGFMGWMPQQSYNRTVADGSSGTTLKVNSAFANEVGAVIALQYTAGGRWYHGVVTAVPDGTTYTVSPALTSTPTTGQAITGMLIKEAYAIQKQPDITNSAATTVEELVTKYNQLLAALRAANVLGDA